MLFEVAVDGVAGLRAAEEGGADRVELCAGLIEGGTTPSIGMIRAAVAAARSVRVHVIVRPRGGDFVYDRDEVDVMVDDVGAVSAAGAHGVVIGALASDGDVDVEACRRLIDAAGDMSVTFHRAFDVARDPLRAIDTIVELGCARILTSGQAPTAPDGSAMLRTLVERAGDRVIVIAGGGVRTHNVVSLVAASGVGEVHFRAGDPTDADVVRALIAATRAGDVAADRRCF